ncbi:MAG: hypothetical protein QOH21_760 [Acidobacteriota bacterium]|nr:hypothetical protein [Acidobacteriota bacterium]
MFGWFKKKTPPQADTSSIRDTLFGDMPLETLAHGEERPSPWAEFSRVRNLLEAGDVPGATLLLQKVVATPDLEPRHYLQAWDQLRKLGHVPSVGTTQILGVVVEVGMKEGLDILAAYADHSARYFNHSGAGVVWEHPDSSLDADIDQLLQTATVIMHKIGPWQSPRPPAPPRGQARISMLAPAGLFFGEAPFRTLARDPLAGPAMAAATRLMQALIAKTESTQPMA